MTAGRESLLAVAVTVALGAVACGGSDDSEEPGSGARAQAGKPLSKPEFVAQMDEICRDADEQAEEYRDELDRVERRTGSESDALEAIAEVFGKANEDAARLDRRYKALHPPPSERQFFDRWSDAIDEQLALSRRLQKAAEREDESAFSTLADELRRVIDRRDGLAAGHGGFEHCGDEGR